MSDVPLRTVEARWFVRGPLPETARDWFDALGPPVEASSRADRYLAPASDALGVKVREGRVEAKRRASTLGPLQAGSSGGRLEAWVKWSFTLAEDAAPDWVEVRKTRWQRRLEAAGGACALELAEVTVDGAAWWSVCLEAEGPDDDARRAALGVAARRWLGRGDAPALPVGASAGYPAWLRGLDAA